MGFEIVTTLKLISDLIQSISENAGKLKGTPKQRFGKTLIALLGMMGDVQESLSKLIEALDTLQKSYSGPEKDQSTREQAALAMEARKISEEFANDCRRFIRWVSQREHFSHVLDLLSPETARSVRETVLADIDYMERGNFLASDLLHAVSDEINQLRKEPTRTSLNKMKRDLQKIDKQIESMKTELRKAATDHLTIEDLF